jgi:hypothetical protein
MEPVPPSGLIHACLLKQNEPRRILTHHLPASLHFGQSHPPFPTAAHSGSAFSFFALQDFSSASCRTWEVREWDPSQTSSTAKPEQCTTTAPGLAHNDFIQWALTLQTSLLSFFRHFFSAFSRSALQVVSISSSFFSQNLFFSSV